MAGMARAAVSPGHRITRNRTGLTCLCQASAVNPCSCNLSIASTLASVIAGGGGGAAAPAAVVGCQMQTVTPQNQCLFGFPVL